MTDDRLYSVLRAYERGELPAVGYRVGSLSAELTALYEQLRREMGIGAWWDGRAQEPTRPEENP